MELEQAIYANDTSLLRHKNEVVNSKMLPFLLAGNFTFTIKSLVTETHFTYKVKKSKKGVIYFVNIQVEQHFVYVGYLCGRSFFFNDKQDELKEDNIRVVSFKWLWHKLINAIDVTEKILMWHEGKCCKCGRKLTDEVSTELGIGPECRKMI